jgi:hypothetical protein
VIWWDARFLAGPVQEYLEEGVAMPNDGLPVFRRRADDERIVAEREWGHLAEHRVPIVIGVDTVSTTSEGPSELGPPAARRT